jgi:hypothetical protein
MNRSDSFRERVANETARVFLEIKKGRPMDEIKPPFALRVDKGVLASRGAFTLLPISGGALFCFAHGR